MDKYILISYKDVLMFQERCCEIIDLGGAPLSGPCVTWVPTPFGGKMIYTQAFTRPGVEQAVGDER